MSFSYNKRAYNLSDLSFSLEHGQSLGIIGPTGAGKSTLAQLLLRLYDIDSGQIRIDGRDISTFPLKELRQKFGVVFQNDVLFKDSLLNNIDMGRKLDMDAIEQAVEVAQTASFIAGSGGYEKPIAVKGVNLSGGQKQRVLIARALAGRPEFLILDDSSSALDYKTDAAFRRSLAQSFSGTTTIIIAQRISSIMHCDKILVLEDGIPQGLGTHEELLKTCDAYREISTIQMGGEDTVKRKATLIRIFGYLLQHKRQLAFILSLSFLGNLLALASPGCPALPSTSSPRAWTGAWICLEFISMRPLCCCFMCPALL